MVTSSQKYFKEVMAQIEAERQLRVAPDEAFVSLDTHEVDEDWLKDSSTTDAHRKNAMDRWFMARFRLPAQAGIESTDGKSSVVPDGVPQDAHKVLRERFDGLVDPVLIDSVADDITDDWGVLWVKTPLALYIAENDAEVGMEADMLSVLDRRVGRLQKIAQMKGDGVTEIAARNLVYASIISAYESFLWETLLFWVNNDSRTVQRLLSRHPDFKSAAMPYYKLLDVSDPMEAGRLLIKSYLQRVIWHQRDKVAELYEKAFSFKMPDASILDDALKIRHDIIHRSGRIVGGGEHAVTQKAIGKLSIDVYVIANRIQSEVGDALVKPGA
ncbi:hypothetical protein D7Y40_05410 [Stenotrophomonas maltophilia]|uniref:hypothetical protein n=1 Tax=Stenotrophomonas maltophilia TaxID=40324 RepID=UPI0015DF6E1D|nr:hypothetical protein [Stenotrophomonas maltophilia]MBA0335840.1 hypothetical protein [Stenotrophomonas maltophilia]MBA0542492.1 hypothetical protein [Stenotrophomonas maltophilia]